MGERLRQAKVEVPDGQSRTAKGKASASRGPAPRRATVALKPGADRVRVILTVVGRGVRYGLLALITGVGCALMPVRTQHVISLAFAPTAETQYFVDPVDSAAVYRTDGLVVKVRYLSRQMLDAEYAQYMAGRVSLNPFTFGNRVDNDKGYVPDRFTVFEVEVNNIGLAKVLLDPRRAVLVTDRGAKLPTWASEKGEAVHTFEEYYRARRGAGGNDQDWYRQRLSIAERGLYNGERPVFKGERNRGKLVFEVLKESVRNVRLELPGFVMGFDADGLPADVVDLVFDFEVKVRIGE